MPIYDFKCPRCEQVVEKLVKQGEIPECTTCKVPLERMLSSGTFKFRTPVHDS